MITQKESFLKEITEKTASKPLTKEDVASLAEKHGISKSEAESIWSFYSHRKSGLKICNGLPCKLNSRLLNSHILDSVPEEEREYVSCLGYCDHAPVVKKGDKYLQVRYEETEEIADGKAPGSAAQTSLSKFVSEGGFSVYRRTAKEVGAKDLTELAKKWSLHGLGGAGFPTYVKWNALAAAGTGEKYLVVNAHEGEPGTFKDRIIMEEHPLDLLEASLVVASSLGISRIIIALKHEYTGAEKILKKALSSMISHFKESPVGVRVPKITISRIPGTYVTGEETALLEAIEGKRSEPRLRPPFPAEVGLYGLPTLIDNVETLVHFLELLRNHYEGHEERTAEKAYCLTGDVERPGAYFLPFGSSASVLLSENGGTELESLKAVMPGGLSGGIIPASRADIKLDFESVRSAGGGLGTGSMIAIAKNRCMVDVMSNVEEFFMKESCGKCFPCRLGTRELSELFGKLLDGEGTMDDISAAEKSASVMLSGSICGLGQAAARMYMDSLKHFRKEIEDHTKGICSAHVCFAGGR